MNLIQSKISRLPIQIKQNSVIINDGALKVLKHCPIFYMGNIGESNKYAHHIIPTHKSQIDCLKYLNPDLYKYGISSDIYRRVIKEHQKNFKSFDLMLLKESYRYQEVESIVTKELRHKKRLLKLNWNKRMQREITYFEDENERQWLIDFIDELVMERIKQTDFINIIL